MVQSFAQGARELGHEVTVFDTATKKLKGCYHCDTCWSKGRACSLDDDFIELAPYLEEADVLVLAAPVYWGYFPSHLKAAIDKLYAYVVPQCKKHLKIKQFALITCGDGADEHAFDLVIPWYQGIAKSLDWEASGYVAIPQLMFKDDVNHTNGLKLARQLGRIF